MFKGLRVRYAVFFLIFFKYPVKMKLFGLTETKLFHFYRIFKNGGGEGVQANPLNLL